MVRSGAPRFGMSKPPRWLAVVALTGMVALMVIVRTGAATGGTARLLNVVQALLLISASLLVGWRWYADSQPSQPTRQSETPEGDPLPRGWGSSILDAEQRAPQRD